MLRSLAVLGLLLVVLACFPSASEGKVLKGHINSKRDFFYLGKFCLGGYDGQMTMKATHISPEEDLDNEDFRLNLYNDDKSGDSYWPDIYKSDLTCKERVARGAKFGTDDGIITPNVPKMSISFNQPSHPHYWYTAVSDCALPDDEKMKIHIEVHWKHLSKNSWHTEFSYEDFDLLTMYMLFFIFWCVAIVVVGCGSFMLWWKGQYGFVVKLFDATCVLTVSSLLFYLIHYSVYTDNGHGVPALLILGDTLDMISYLTFAAVLLLVAKGAALERMDLREMKWDFLIFGVLSFAYVVFFCWQVSFPYIKPQSNDYKWNSPPGIILLVIQGGIWLYFVAISVISFLRETHAQKKFFTLVFATVFSVWFLWLPFMVSICEGVPSYDRWKVILGIKLSLQMIFFAILFVLQLVARLTDVLMLTKKTSILNPADSDAEDTPYGTL